MSEQQTPSPIYIFISQSCKHSRDLIQEIQKKPELSKRVQVVSVENTPKLPPGLTKVPGILVDGNIKMGSDCFLFVENFGEIQSSPTYSSSGGFEAEGFSFIGDEGGGDVGGTESFSFLGAENGTKGIDSGQADKQLKNEQVSSQGSVNMDTITQQRQQDVQQMQGGRAPGGQKIY